MAVREPGGEEVRTKQRGFRESGLDVCQKVTGGTASIQERSAFYREGGAQPFHCEASVVHIYEVML
jgi:hypothetical protein